MVVIVAGLMTVGAGLYSAAHLMAQQPAQPAQAPAAMRVGVINLHLVLKGYQKTKIYDAEVETIIAPMRKQGEKMKEDMKSWENAMKPGVAGVTDENREQYAKAIRQTKHALEELEAEASKKVTKKREEQLVQLYREIEDAVKRYATAQGFTMVLQYTEPEAAEKYTPANIQRKLAGSSQTGCTVPMYFHDALDISAAVIANLNAQYPPSQPNATASPTPR
jgi:Skp family chaperone for outer membrane proteins